VTVFYPEAVKAQGNTALGIGTTEPANVNTPSLATDLALSAAGLNASCYVFGDITFTDTQNKGTAPARMCTTEQLQEFGNKTHEIGTIQLVWSPQDDDSEEVNAAKALLTDGAELWFYIRRGLPARTTAFAATQKVEVRHVRIGGGRPGKTGDGEFDQFSWMVDAVDLEPPVYDAVLAA